MRFVLVAFCLSVACNKSGATQGLPEGTRAAGPVELLDAHRGATALWHDDGLWVSVVQDRQPASRIRLSRDAGSIGHTLTGWVAGVHGGRAAVVVSEGDQLVAETVDETGRTTVLGTLPAASPPLALAVTAAGEVVVAVGELREAIELAIVGPGGTRRFASLVLPGDAIAGLATDPTGPRLALALHQVVAVGGLENMRRARLVVVETGSGAALSSVEFGPGFSATDGQVWFDGSGALWLHHDGQFERFEGPSRTTFLNGLHVDARNLVSAADGSAIAWVAQHGRNDMAPSPDVWCGVHYVLTTDTARHGEPVRRFEGDCYFGLGMAIIDGTLWIAPP